MVSSASSPPGEGFLKVDYSEILTDVPTLGKDAEPAFMRTADTITKHGRPTTQTATGAALEDWQGNSYDDDHEGDDDSDDGMIMGGPSRML